MGEFPAPAVTYWRSVGGERFEEASAIPAPKDDRKCKPWSPFLLAEPASVVHGRESLRGSLWRLRRAARSETS
jgi:hypothetical protein